MPQRFMQKYDMSKETYLNSIYDSIIIKDIVKRFRIKDIDLLNSNLYINKSITNILSKEKIGAYLENIIHNELLARGYPVQIGTLENSEIDFIATKFDEKYIFK